jgi:hypothetical protein
VEKNFKTCGIPVESLGKTKSTVKFCKDSQIRDLSLKDPRSTGESCKSITPDSFYRLRSGSLVSGKLS